MNSSDVDDDDDSAASNNVNVILSSGTSRCGVNLYWCPFRCDFRFPLRDFSLTEVRNHFRRCHADFVGYRCHALLSPASQIEDHERYPRLMGTNVTDTLMQLYIESATDLIVGLPGKMQLRFAHVEVIFVANNTRLYVCTRCNFNSNSILDYKKHAVLFHVNIDCDDDDFKEGGDWFPVVGPPHQLE